MISGDLAEYLYAAIPVAWGSAAFGEELVVRLDDSVGEIAAGRRPDFVLLDADPLRDIRNTARIRAVVLNGRFLSRADLDALLVAAERMARASFTEGR